MRFAIKKNEIKLFTSLEHSDIIVASPLGLRFIIGIEGEENRNYSFLSSIEILVVDRASTIFM